MSAAVAVAAQQELTARRPKLELITGRTPRTAQESSLVKITFEVHNAHAPALRAAVEDLSTEIGTRLEKDSHPFPLEDSLTNAAAAVGALRAAVNDAVPTADVNYLPRSRR